MAIDPVDEFKNLWDGTEPGWQLCRIDHIEWEITIHFATGGPTIREVASMRQLIDAFRDKPAIDVLNRLRGASQYRVNQPFGNISSRQFAAAAEQLSLNVALESHDRGGYLPMDADGGTLIIEDDDVAQQVIQNMLDAGVPVTEVYAD